MAMYKMTLTYGTVVLAALVYTTVTAVEVDSAAIRACTERQILPEGLPTNEVQAFTESRIPLMPVAVDAAAWERIAERTRQQLLSEVVLCGEAAAWDAMPTRVQWLETLDQQPDYKIRKLRFEAVPGMWIPALLYEPNRLEGKVPIVLNVNGHDPEGKAVAYKQIRCINLAKRGMLALNVEWLRMGQLQGEGFDHYRLNQLDLCGTSGLAPFYLSLKRSLDVLLEHAHADPERVAVAGLSGGGWQTILISALDTRVRLANPVAGYSGLRTRVRHSKDLGDSEQMPSDFARYADYTHLTALLAPRPTLLTYNAKDQCCFEANYALQPLLEAARPVFALYGAQDQLQHHINEVPGDHNFGRDNREAFYRAVGQHFYPGDDTFQTNEIDVDDEVQTSDELLVELPADNRDLHDLAMLVSRGLPRDGELPIAAVDAARTRLGRIVGSRDYDVDPEIAGEDTVSGVRCVYWRLRLSDRQAQDRWTVAAIEIAPEGANTTVVLAGDDGRTSDAVLTAAKAQLANGNRVVLLDPLGVGESHVNPWTLMLLVACVGERPAGLQASQFGATLNWCREMFAGEVRLHTIGPRTGLSGLVAAGMWPAALDRIEIHGGYKTLHEVIEQNLRVKDGPELFCFGLLKSFDIQQLSTIAGSSKVTFANEP